MKKSIFSKLKKGSRVFDILYGNGIVTKKLKTKVYIQLYNIGTSKPCVYDKSHVNKFIIMKY